MNSPDEHVLTTLAKLINDEHSAAVDAARRAVEHAIRCGEFLMQAKAQIHHGQWGAWIKLNCAFSDRTARAYMQLAAMMPELDEAKRQRVAEMPLREALAAIAEPAETPAPELASRFIPNPGEMLRLIADKGPNHYEAWIQASDAGEFYYVSVIQNRADESDAIVTGLKKPVATAGVDLCLHEAGFPMDLHFSTEALLCNPQSFNRWLYDSHEQYVQRGIRGR